MAEPGGTAPPRGRGPGGGSGDRRGTSGDNTGPKRPITRTGPVGTRPISRIPTTTFTLPEYWGQRGDLGLPGTIRYQDIRFPESNAIAPDLLVPLCYGEVRIGGTAIGFGSVPGNELYHGWGVVVWCEGEIQSVDKLYVNGAPVSAYTNDFGTVAFGHYVGDGTQYCQDNTNDIFCPYPRTNPGSGSNGPYEVAGLKTAAYTKLDVTTNQVVGRFWWQMLTMGSPPSFEFAADVHGLKLYDPRTATTVYSANPILIARDLFKRAGLKDSDLDDSSSLSTSFKNAAAAVDAAGLTCHVAFAAGTPLMDAINVVLQTCNGSVVNSNGKKGISLDLPNAGSAVATLSEEDGDLWDLQYEWLSSRDRFTSLAVGFANKDADYIADQTPFIEDPGVALGTAPLRQTVIEAPGVNTLDAAVILRDYLYNSQAICFRLSGTMRGQGILLAAGDKVHITTLKGVDTDFILTQINTDQQGFFTFVCKPYDSAVWGSTPITQGPPLTGPGWPFTPPEVASAVVFPTISGQACHWRAPRKLASLLGTMVVKNPGGAGADWWAHIDLGSSTPRKLGRFTSYLPTGGGTVYTASDAQWSDDDSSWTSVSGFVGRSWVKKSSPTVEDHATDEWETPTLQHRYWRVKMVGGAPVAYPDGTTLTGNTGVYEVVAEVDQLVTSYEIHNSSNNLTLGTPEHDPVFTVIPAGNLPTSTKPLDLSTIINIINGSTATVRPCIVPVCGGTEGEPVLLIEDVASSAVHGFYAVSQDSAGATLRQAGAAVDIDSVAADFVDLDGAASPAVSGSGHARLATDGSHVLASINGGAYAPLGGGTGSSPLTTKGDLYTYDTADQRLGVGADGKVLTADSSKATGLDWKTPTAPPSVPLTTKGDILGYDTANNRVPVGADGKVLTADSSKALGLDWKVPFASPLTTKGDLLGYDTANNRVPVGADGKVLVADSSKALGVDWKAGVGTGSTIIEKPDGVIDGDNRFFTLTYTPSTTRIALFIDGQRVAAQTDYYRTGKNVTLQAYATKPRGSVLAIYTTLDTVTVPGPGNPEGPVPGTASTWTTETIGSKNWNSVCWSPDLKLFCAVASDTGTQSIATSPDGVNWTLQTIPNTPIDGGWKGICWGNGQFVVMNNLADEFSITTLTSPDGVTWTQHGYSVWPTTYGWGWDAVVWSQRFGYYVAVQDFNTSGIDKCAATSPDGANWTLRNTPATQDYFQSICWSPEKNLFVAGGTSSGGNVFLMTSPDGITWTGQTPPTYTAGFGALTRVIWVAELGLFLACGTFNPGVVGTSPDGVTWTNVSVTLGGYGAGALVWSPVRQLLILGGIDAGLHSIKTSTDGSTWNTESVPIAPNNLDLAAGDAPDVIVSVGSGGSCMISLS